MPIEDIRIRYPNGIPDRFGHHARRVQEQAEQRKAEGLSSGAEEELEKEKVVRAWKLKILAKFDHYSHLSSENASETSEKSETGTMRAESEIAEEAPRKVSVICLDREEVPSPADEQVRSRSPIYSPGSPLNWYAGDYPALTIAIPDVSAQLYADSGTNGQPAGDTNDFYAPWSARFGTPSPSTYPELQQPPTLAGHPPYGLTSLIPQPQQPLTLAARMQRRAYGLYEEPQDAHPLAADGRDDFTDCEGRYNPSVGDPDIISQEALEYQELQQPPAPAGHPPYGLSSLIPETQQSQVAWQSEEYRPWEEPEGAHPLALHEGDDFYEYEGHYDDSIDDPDDPNLMSQETQGALEELQADYASLSADHARLSEELDELRERETNRQKARAYWRVNYSDPGVKDAMRSLTAAREDLEWWQARHFPMSHRVPGALGESVRSVIKFVKRKSSVRNWARGVEGMVEQFAQALLDEQRAAMAHLQTCRVALRAAVERCIQQGESEDDGESEDEERPMGGNGGRKRRAADAEVADMLPRRSKMARKC